MKQIKIGAEINKNDLDKLRFSTTHELKFIECVDEMSKTGDKAVRVLNQAVDIAKNMIEQQSCDIDILVKRCYAKDDEIIELQRQVKFEKAERILQERKSEAVLYFGMVAMVIYFAIIGFYVFIS